MFVQGCTIKNYELPIRYKKNFQVGLKIRAAISNAKAFMEVQREFGSFSSYLWAFVNHKPIINLFKKMEDVPATSSISDKLSKDMKNRGFKFVGSTVIYAHMQACGMVNDHLTDCFRHPSNQ
jgi:DNA-3-methyladenine glycosylase I